MEITKAKLMEYLVVQFSGLTNMLDGNTVARLSDTLTPAEVVEIIKRYGELREQYPFSQEELDYINEDAETLRGCYE